VTGAQFDFHGSHEKNDFRNFLSELQNFAKVSPTDVERLRVILPQTDEFYFTTAEKKIVENFRCIPPNFIKYFSVNAEFIMKRNT